MALPTESDLCDLARRHGTPAGGSVYQALVLVLAGVVLYAFLKARRENLGQVTTGTEK